MRRDRREQLNGYRRDRREESRQAKLRAEYKTVDPDLFLKSGMLLRTVKGWVDVAGVDYARRSLSKTGVADRHIDGIIEAALKNSAGGGKKACL